MWAGLVRYSTEEDILIEADFFGLLLRVKTDVFCCRVEGRYVVRDAGR